MKNLKPVKQMDIKKNMKVRELVNEMASAGVFGAGRLAKAAFIFRQMADDKKCRVFFGLAGAMVPAGMKNIIIDMIENKHIDVFVTTGANLTHDLIEALGFRHYKGKKDADDKKLFDKGIDRIYESYMPNDAYKALEDFFNKNFDKLKDKANIKDFLWEIGKLLNKKSILTACYKQKIPVFCPAIADSGIGLMIYNRIAAGKKTNINAFDDLKDILDIAWQTEKAGIFYIGGGTPKNYIQQAMQFTGGASYGIQITMDRPEPGGSSGAELREGISWGKMDSKGRFVDVICDATIALPIIYSFFKS